jgi:hypothetical protein
MKLSISYGGGHINPQSEAAAMIKQFAASSTSFGPRVGDPKHGGAVEGDVVRILSME